MRVNKPKNGCSTTVLGHKWMGPSSYQLNFKKENIQRAKPVVKGKGIVDTINNTKYQIFFSIFLNIKRSCVHSNVPFFGNSVH